MIITQESRNARKIPHLTKSDVYKVKTQIITSTLAHTMPSPNNMKVKYVRKRKREKKEDKRNKD